MSTTLIPQQALTADEALMSVLVDRIESSWKSLATWDTYSNTINTKQIEVSKAYSVILNSKDIKDMERRSNNSLRDSWIINDIFNGRN
jgi:hypothetical protein